MEMKKCHCCGGKFDIVEEGRAVRGADGQVSFWLCDTCLESECNAGRVISCEGCGNYFTAGALHDEEIEGESFTPCPSCGADVVEGLHRKKFAEMHKPIRYAAIVRGPNSSRGYIVRARTGEDPLKKLAEKVDLRWMDTIHISEILLDEDEF